MMIAVIASHRQEAFEACRYVLEEIKKRVPIWKKEYKFLKNNGHLLVALNGKYVDSSVLLKEGDEVALFPPVSGG